MSGMSLSPQTALRGALVAASLFGALPYAVAILCNLMYGWPQGNKKYRRALHPKKVYAVNYAVLKTLSDVRHAKLALQWTWFYWTASSDHLIKEIPFGSSETKLDLYYPRRGRSGVGRPLPVVVFLYGGAWSSGSKNMYGLLCSQIADELDAIVLTPDYSKFPKGYADDMMQDVVDCLAWIQENIENYRGNKDQVMLIGHSAGAHLCFMSVFELLLRCQNEDSPPISPSAAMRRQLSTSSGNGIKFEEKYFDGSNGDSSDTSRPDERSTDTSFLLVEGDQKNDQSMEESQNLRSLIESVVTDTGDTSETTDEKEVDKEQQEEEQQPESESTGSMYFVKEEDFQEGPVLTRRVRAQKDDDDDDGKDGEDNTLLSQSRRERSSSTAACFVDSVKAIVGLAGVYNISDHFEHEYYRGIEDISAMTRAMYGPSHFDRLSPSLTVNQFKQGTRLPKMVLVHGDADTIVPISSTNKFASAMEQIPGTDVRVRVIPNCNHTDVILDLMVPERKYYQTMITILLEAAEQAFQ